MSDERQSDEPSDEVDVGDLDLVLRRAAEIEAGRPPRDAGLIHDRDVKQLAAEIGISDSAVERALVELRAGALVRRERPRGLSERLWSPRQLVVARTVPGPVDEVQQRVRRFLGEQGFAVKRDFGTKQLWRREGGVWHALRSMFDESKQRLEGCAEITASVAAARERDGAVDVVLTLELDELRGSARANAWGGGLAFGGLSLGAGVVGGIYASALLFPVGALVAAGVSYAIGRAAVSAYRKQAVLLEENVAGFLDTLERRSG